MCSSGIPLSVKGMFMLPKGSSRSCIRRLTALTALLPAAMLLFLAAPLRAQQPAVGAAASSSDAQSSGAPTPSALPRGKKLFLKDGSYQLVREY